MAKHRLRSTVLFCGFGAYLVLCIIVQTLYFMQYAGQFSHAPHVNLVPFMVLWTAWTGSAVISLPLAMWLQLAGVMVPFGLCLFLWVEDCTHYRSIAAITAGFSGVLYAVHYLLTAPVFDIDFMTAALCGSLTGYLLAVLVVELLFTRRIQPLLNQPTRHYKKA